MCWTLQFSKVLVCVSCWYSVITNAELHLANELVACQRLKPLQVCPQAMAGVVTHAATPLNSSMLGTPLRNQSARRLASVASIAGKRVSSKSSKSSVLSTFAIQVFQGISATAHPKTPRAGAMGWAVRLPESILPLPSHARERGHPWWHSGSFSRWEL